MFAVSVVIPVFNVEKYISRSLNAIFSQTMADRCEFILINDASVDSSANIIKEIILNYKHLRENIFVFSHDKNCGLSYTRQDGIEKARGKYILFYDSDDWCEKDYIERLYEKAEAERADIVCCNFWYEYTNSSMVKKEKPVLSGKQAVKYLMDGSLDGYLWIRLFRKDLFSEYNILWNYQLSMFEDLDVMIKAYYYVDRITYIDKNLYHYEKGNNTSITASRTEKNILSLLNMAADIRRFFSDKEDKNQFIRDFRKLKLRIKAMVLMMSGKDKRKKYANLFPETNHIILLLQTHGIPAHQKICTWLVSNRCYLPAEIIYKIIEIAKTLNIRR